MSPRIPTNVRVLNLFFDLLTSERGWSKSQVRATAGYAELSESAFESAFQRDKDALREAGIVLEIRERPHGEVYRVSSASFPEGSHELSRTDLALIHMAVRAWSTMTPDSEAMLMSKLAARSDETPGDGPVPMVLNLEGAQVVADILDAIERRQVITFVYSAGSGTVANERAVEPLQLTLRGRALYLSGWDLDREDHRTFRLSRIRSAIELLGAPGDARSIADFDGIDRNFLDELMVSPLVMVRKEDQSLARALFLTDDHDTLLAALSENPPVPDSDPDNPLGKVVVTREWSLGLGTSETLGWWISKILQSPSDIRVLGPHDLEWAIRQRLRAAASWPHTHHSHQGGADA